MNCFGLPAGFETGFVEHGKAEPDAAPRQCFVVHPTVGSRAKHPDGLQQVAFATAIGTNENIDATETDVNVFKGFECFDFDSIQHNAL